MFLSRKRSWQLTLIPALLTAIAYVDPGNFGVNVAAGADHRYALIWVVVLASTTAALIQYLAAKLGMATGKSLAGHLTERSRPGLRIAHWAQAELVVVMTDLAEVVGGAIALNLLFGVPLVLGATAVVAFSLVVLALRRPHREGFVSVVLALLGVIVVAFAVEVALVGVDVRGALGGLRPTLPDDGAALLAVGIVGATVMPHALHFHSSMSRAVVSDAAPRAPGQPGGGTRGYLRDHRVLVVSVGVAMTLAGLANVALMVFSARLAPGSGADLGTAQASLAQTAGGLGGVLFGVALLASGVASTIVGVFTGQVVLQDFMRRSISAPLRRLVTVAPALALLGLGLDATRALVLSQVVLSFALPGTLVPLVRLTASRAVMGDQVNRRLTTAVAVAATAVITAMDGYLLVTTFT